MRKSNHFRDLTDMNEPSHYNHHITPPRQNQRLSDQIALLSDERIFLPVKWQNVHKIIVFIFHGLSYPNQRAINHVKHYFCGRFARSG